MDKKEMKKRIINTLESGGEKTDFTFMHFVMKTTNLFIQEKDREKEFGHTKKAKKKKRKKSKRKK